MARNPNFPDHRWTGWPGAICYYCGWEDEVEHCLASHIHHESLEAVCETPPCKATEEHKTKVDTRLDGGVKL